MIVHNRSFKWYLKQCCKIYDCRNTENKEYLHVELSSISYDTDLRRLEKLLALNSLGSNYLLFSGVLLHDSNSHRVLCKTLFRVPPKLSNPLYSVLRNWAAKTMSPALPYLSFPSPKSKQAGLWSTILWENPETTQGRHTSTSLLSGNSVTPRIHLKVSNYFEGVTPFIPVKPCDACRLRFQSLFINYNIFSVSSISDNMCRQAEAT